MQLPALQTKQALQHAVAQAYKGVAQFHSDFRMGYVETTSWYLLSQETAQVLATFLKGKKVVEVGAGTGYLAAHMRNLGVWSYKAYDNHSTHYTEDAANYGVISGDALEVNLAKYDIVVMCWPPYNHPFGEQIVKRLQPGQILVYQGEVSGCCGTDMMFDLLWEHFDEMSDLQDELNRHHVQHEGLHDEWVVYKKVR